MRITFNIERLVPRFLLNDPNGYALAKAIEKAFRICAEAAQRGIDIIQDPYKMPEWRLDERAGELNCIYDYNGTIEQKRYWIINATYLFQTYGTPQAIYNFLEGFFQNIKVEEYWEYGGDLFHFRVAVSDPNNDQAKLDWAIKAIGGVKNCRSILDDVFFENFAGILVSADTDYRGSFYPYVSSPAALGGGATQDDADQVADNDLTEEWGNE